MKINFLLTVSLALILASCNSVYKTGQTPDDVYYSKARQVITTRDNYERNDRNTAEDRQIRMAAYDYRWRTLDDKYNYDYRYSPYSYGYNYGYYYNPYYYSYPVYSGGVKFIDPKNTTIRMTNLNTYNNTITQPYSTKGGGSVRITSVRGYNNQNTTNNSYTVPVYENVYTPSGNNSSNNNNNNSSSGSSSSGSRSTSSGSAVSRPPRGN